MNDEAYRPRPARAVRAVLLLLVAGGGAAAGDPPAAEPASEERITYYETATVRAAPLETATASITVLGREEIEALDVSSVADLIRFIPGLDLVSAGPRGGTSFAQIRGGDPNFTAVLLDGVPLNDSTDAFGGSVNLNSLSVRFVERVEIVRGPVSSAYGSAGLGGVINVITRRGETDDVRVTADVAAGGDAGDGSTSADGSILHGAVSVGRATEDGDWFVGTTWEDEEELVADDAFEQLALVGTWRSGIGEHGDLKLDGRVADWDTTDYPEASGGVLGTGDTRSSEHEEASLGLELLLGAGTRQHKVYSTLYRHDLDRETPAIPDPFQPRPAAVEKTEYWKARAGWAYPVLERGTQRLELGAEGTLEDGDNESTLIDAFGPGVDADTSYTLERSIGAGFAEYRGSFGRFEVEAGARVDVPEGFDTETSPRLGLAYRFGNDTTRLRGSVGRGFKLPSFYALGDPLIGDPDLEPETSTGGELGVDQSFASGGLTTSVSVFRYDYEDLIDFDFNVFRLVNREQVNARGAEAEIAWTAVQDLDVRADVTYQEVEDEATGDVLLHRPEWVGGLRVDWQVTSRVGWETDWRGVSESFDEQVPTGRGEVPGYALVGTALRAELSPQWLVRLRIDNLLDKEYATLIGFPGVERTVRVGLRYQLR